MAKHEFGTMDTEQNEYAWGAFLNFWKWTFIVSVLIIFMFLSIVL